MYTNHLGEEYLMNKYVFWCYWSELKKKKTSVNQYSLFIYCLFGFFLKIVPDSC